MTEDEIAAIVTALGHLMQVIRDADPADKADLCALWVPKSPVQDAAGQRP